jgi:hypothetical protein
MSGRSRLPGGEQRRASQRHSRPAAPAKIVIAPRWHTGDKVYWQGYVGQFLRDTPGGECELLIGTRTYRVHKGELKRA